MRLIMTVFCFVFSLSAFANDLVCERRTGPGKTEYTMVDTWPSFSAQIVSKECVGNGGVEFCVERTVANVANQGQICGYRMNVDWECRTRDVSDNHGNRSIETRCPRYGISARIQVNAAGQGRMACIRGNTVEHMWQLGSCI